MNDENPEAGIARSTDDTQAAGSRRRGFSGLQVLAIVGLVILVTAGATFWLIRTYVYPADFRPVELSTREQGRLDDKLRQLGLDPVDLLPNAQRPADSVDENGRLRPEAYREDAAARDIRLNEREINALVASSPEFARRFAIDLSDSLASAKLLIPMDPDFPVLGGKTLRINAGIELDYRNDQPVVVLRGVSIMGVPIPDAWLGNLKNVDLVRQFGGSRGFWRSFAAGVELVEIREGELHVLLRE